MMNDPESMEILVKSQVNKSICHSLICYEILSKLYSFFKVVDCGKGLSVTEFICQHFSCLGFQNIEYQAEIAKLEAEHQDALDNLRRYVFFDVSESCIDQKQHIACSGDRGIYTVHQQSKIGLEK